MKPGRHSRQLEVGKQHRDEARIWTPSYTALGIATFLTFAHQGFLTPIIPLYIVSLGGSALTVGLVLAAFSTPSFTLRPYIGYWADRHGLPFVFRAGTILLAVCGMALYSPIIWLVAGVNALRGVAWAAVNTGGNALLANLAPLTRRGEASGYYTVFQSAGMAATPALAVWWVGSTESFFAVFVVAALFGVLAYVVMTTMGGSRLRAPRGVRVEKQEGAQRKFVDRNALLPSVIMASLSAAQPAAIGLLPLRAIALGLEVKQLTVYFVTVGLGGLVSRAALGVLSDRLGRRWTIVAGMLAAVTGLVGLLFATTLLTLIVGGLLFAIGHGGAQPALTALAIDRTDPDSPGMAMGTYSAAFQGGMSVGSVVLAALADAVGFWAMYVAAIASASAGLITAIRFRAAIDSGSAVAPIEP